MKKKNPRKAVCIKCGVKKRIFDIRDDSENDWLDGVCIKCFVEQVTVDHITEDDEFSDCEDCGKLVKINQDESKHFCNYCSKGLCNDCKAEHDKLKDVNKCVLLYH